MIGLGTGLMVLLGFNLKFGEGDTIGIKYVVVQKTENLKFKNTSHEFIFPTCKKTTIVPLTKEEEQDFPHYPFAFTSISEISNPTTIKSELLLGSFYKCKY